MAVIGIAVVVVAVTMVVIAAFMIPTIVEIRKTAVELRTLAIRLESELHPLLQDARAALTEVKVLTESATEKTARMENLFETLSDTGKNIRKINSVVGAVAGTVTTSSLWMVGAKAAAKALISRFSKKGEH